MFEPFTNLWDWAERDPFFRPFFSGFLPEFRGEFMPRVDVYRENNEVVVKADLPGIRKEDLHVTIDEGDLVIEGERKIETRVEKEDFFRMERSCGTFYRRMPLGLDEVSPAKVKAEFKDGVLEVRIPQPIEKKPKKLEVAVH